MRMRLKNGRVTDCEETYARRLLEQGAAEPAGEAAAPEEATEEAPQPPKKGGRKRGV